MEIADLKILLFGRYKGSKLHGVIGMGTIYIFMEDIPHSRYLEEKLSQSLVRMYDDKRAKTFSLLLNVLFLFARSGRLFFESKLKHSFFIISLQKIKQDIRLDAKKEILSFCVSVNSYDACKTQVYITII